MVLRWLGPVPLLLLDLDNTLIDRAAAFRRWAVSFAAGVGAPADAADWLIMADRDGLEPRERLAATVRQRFGLTAAEEADVPVELRRGLVENIELDPAVPAALDRARSAGWVPVIVTNGTVQRQELKLNHTALRSMLPDGSSPRARACASRPRSSSGLLLTRPP